MASRAMNTPNGIQHGVAVSPAIAHVITNVAIESAKLVLGQPQLISMTTAATYNMPGMVYKETFQHGTQEMIQLKATPGAD